MNYNNRIHSRIVIFSGTYNLTTAIRLWCEVGCGCGCATDTVALFP